MVSFAESRFHKGPSRGGSFGNDAVRKVKARARAEKAKKAARTEKAEKAARVERARKASVLSNFFFFVVCCFHSFFGAFSHFFSCLRSHRIEKAVMVNYQEMLTVGLAGSSPPVAPVSFCFSPETSIVGTAASAVPQ